MPAQTLPAIGAEVVQELPPVGGEVRTVTTVAPPPQTPPAPKPDMSKGEWDPNYSMSERFRRATGIPHEQYNSPTPGSNLFAVKGLLDNLDLVLQHTVMPVEQGIESAKQGNYSKGARQAAWGVGTGVALGAAPQLVGSLYAAPIQTIANLVLTGGTLAVTHPVVAKIGKESGLDDDQAGLLADAVTTAVGYPVGSKVNKGVASMTEWATEQQALKLPAQFKALREKVIPSTPSRSYTDAEWNDAMAAYKHFNKGKVPSTPKEFEEGLNLARDGIEQTVADAISRYPADTIPTNPWAAAIQKLQRSTNETFASRGIAALERDYSKLKGPLTLEQADKLRLQLTADNNAVLSANKYDRHLSRMTDPAYAAREAALDALRNGTYDQLEARGVQGIRELRKTEGSVLKLRDSAEYVSRTGNAEVAGSGAPGVLRQSLGYAVGTMARLATGSPLASVPARWAADKVLPGNMTKDQLFAVAMRLGDKLPTVPFRLPTFPSTVQPRGPLPTTGATTVTPTPFAQAPAPGAQGGQIPPMAAHGPVTPQAPPGPLQQAAPGTVNWNAAAPLPPIPLVRSSTGAAVTPPTGPIPMGQMVPTQPAPPLARSSTGSVVTPPTGPMVQGQSVPVQPAPPVVRSGSGAAVQPPTGPTGPAVGAPVRTGTPFPAPTVPVPPVEAIQQAILASAAKLKIQLTPQQGEAALALVRTGKYDADTAVRFMGRPAPVVPTPVPAPAPAPAPPPQAPNAAGVRTGTAWGPGAVPQRPGPVQPPPEPTAGPVSTPPVEPTPPAPASTLIREPGTLTEADLTPKELDLFRDIQNGPKPMDRDELLRLIALDRVESAAAASPTTVGEVVAPAKPSRGKKKASAPVSDEGVVVGHEIDPHAPVKDGGYRVIRSTEPGATPAPLLTDARRAMLERMVADFENFPPTPGTLVKGSEQWRYGYDREQYVRGAAGTHVSDDIRVFSGRHGSNGEMRQAIEQLLSGATPSNKLHTAALAAADGYLAGELRPPLTPGNRVTTVADVLGTGEVQPRLPEAGAVRDVNVPTPTMEAPFSLSGGVSERPQGTTSDLFAAPRGPVVDLVDDWMVDANGNRVLYVGIDPKIKKAQAASAPRPTPTPKREALDWDAIAARVRANPEAASGDDLRLTVKHLNNQRSAYLARQRAAEQPADESLLSHMHDEINRYRALAQKKGHMKSKD